MSIADQLKKLEKDPEFQKRIKVARMEARRKGRPFGTSSVGVSEETEARAILNKILDRLYIAISGKFPQMPREVLRLSGPIVTLKGEYQYVINFEPALVHRESLYREGYPDGLENIIALFSHGSKPSKNAVWNRVELEDWNYKYGHQEKGTYRLGRHSFIQKGFQTQPDPFLRNEIMALNDELNKMGITIILDPKYYP